MSWKGYQLEIKCGDWPCYNLRVATDVILLTKVCFVNAVDLCELDTLFFQLGGGFLVMGSESLTVTTPANETF